MNDWQKQVTEEVHGSELPLVDPVASMRFISSSSGSLERFTIEFRKQLGNYFGLA